MKLKSFTFLFVYVVAVSCVGKQNREVNVSIRNGHTFSCEAKMKMVIYDANGKTIAHSTNSSISEDESDSYTKDESFLIVDEVHKRNYERKGEEEVFLNEQHLKVTTQCDSMICLDEKGKTAFRVVGHCSGNRWNVPAGGDTTFVNMYSDFTATLNVEWNSPKDTTLIRSIINSQILKPADKQFRKKFENPNEG